MVWEVLYKLDRWLSDDIYKEEAIEAIDVFFGEDKLKQLCLKEALDEIEKIKGKLVEHFGGKFINE
jgi:hypothetical protein